MYEVGIDLRIRNSKIVFVYCTKQYEIRSHPSEPCTYICLNDEIVHTLHNAFDTSLIEKMILRDKSFKAINGHYIGLEMMREIFAATIDSCRAEIDFDFAENLAIQRRDKRQAITDRSDELRKEEMLRYMNLRRELKRDNTVYQPKNPVRATTCKTPVAGRYAVRKSTHDFISDGVLLYGVMVGRFIFKKEQKVVYAISDFPHIGPSDVLMIYQLSKSDYDMLLSKSLPHQIPEPHVSHSWAMSFRREFLCGDSAYCKRNRFSLDIADQSLVGSLTDGH